MIPPPLSKMSKLIIQGFAASREIVSQETSGCPRYAAESGWQTHGSNGGDPLDGFRRHMGVHQFPLSIKIWHSIAGWVSNSVNFEVWLP